MSSVNPQTESQAAIASLLAENSEGLLTCVHCGLCLPACPTYRELGNENDSPRGRIYLMRALVEGRLDPSNSFNKHIDLCLGCRACETVCPSGVPYGQLLEAARVEVAQTERKRGSVLGGLTRFVLTQVFTRPKLLSVALGVTRLLRDSGLAQLAVEAELVGGRLRFALALLLASRPSLTKSQPARAAAEHSKPGTRVGLLRGCVMEGLFRQTNRATERVLARNDCTVAEVTDQVCCGALHAHAGHIESARRLAKRNIDAFLESGCERIITNAAGCGAAMKEYTHLLSGDPAYAGRAREFSARVRDICEFLAERGLKQPSGRVERRVAYDAPCHLIHAQRISQPPVELLKAIPGLRLVPLAGSESCCGGAGIYNLLHPEVSSAILSEKIENIRAAGADTVATGNPGCIMQIKAGLLLRGLSVDVVHPVELLDAAYHARGQE